MNRHYRMRKHAVVFSFETLVQNIQKKILKVPIRAEGWGLFFFSVERAFIATSVLNIYKTEINLNLLGVKPFNIIAYLNNILN